LHRSYWVWSAGLAVVWGLLLVVNGVVNGLGSTSWHNVAMVAGGFWIGWIACTIARFVYPPPRRWTGPPPTITA
jgi:hypothetical protein